MWSAMASAASRKPRAGAWCASRWPSRRAAGPARRRRENENATTRREDARRRHRPTSSPRPWRYRAARNPGWSLAGSRTRRRPRSTRACTTEARGRRVGSLSRSRGDSRPPRTRRAATARRAQPARGAGRGKRRATPGERAANTEGCAKARMAVGSRRVPRSAGARRAVTTSAKGVSQRPPCRGFRRRRRRKSWHTPVRDNWRFFHGVPRPLADASSRMLRSATGFGGRARVASRASPSRRAARPRVGLTVRAALPRINDLGPRRAST